VLVACLAAAAPVSAQTAREILIEHEKRTDFNFEDMEEFDQSRHEASLLPERQVDGPPCHVIQLVPTDRSAYENLVVLMRKDTLWLVRVVAFDRPQPADRFTIRNLVREGKDDARPCFPAPLFPAASRNAASASARPAHPLPTASAEFTGYLDATGHLFFHTPTDRDGRSAFWGTAVATYARRIGKVRASASARAEVIPSGERGSLAFDPADRELRRSPLSLRELSLLAPVGSAIDVQAGRFVVDWSTTDVYSPADAFVPRDVSDLFAPEKLPLWGARLIGEHGRMRVDLHAAFITTPWRLPRMDGRLSPFSLADVYLLDARSPPPRRGFEGIRVQRTGDTWDVGVWARHGVRPAPILTGDLDNAEERGERRYIPLGRRFAREVGFGLQVSREVAQWRLRGEVSHQRSADPDLKNAALWTLEAQRALRSGVLTMTVAGNALEAPMASALYFDRAFLPGFVIGADQKEDWGSWRISWLGTYEKIGGLLQVDLRRDLGDRVKLTVGADVPDGSRLESLGAFANAQRVRTSLRYAW
jgi:hypothetical protein